MIGERNYRSYFPFTASQWQELEQQVLTFRYLMSGIPVPPGLISTVITTPSKSSSSSSTLFPQQPTLPFGLGCFQVGYGRKIDPEPGRCRRTDGKKWRCSKEAHPDSKYCEKHMHRTKAKAKKQFDVYNNNSSTKSPTNHSTSSSSPYKSCLPYPPISASSSLSHSNINLTYANKTPTNHTTNYYPFMSGQSSSLSNVSLSTQDNGNRSQWLDLDGDFHAQPVKKDIRHCDEIKGVVDEMTWGSKASKINATCSSRYENYRSHDEERSLGVDKEHESQKLFHHFLGDWPMKLKSSQSQAVGVLSRSK